jgi:membrane protease YdiL (CAAX protease family)
LSESTNESTNEPTNEPIQDPISSKPIPSAEASTMHRIFFGPDGLRAGWSLLLFLALFATLLLSVNVIGHKLHPSPSKAGAAAAAKSMTLRSALISESIPFAITFLVTWIMAKIEKRPNSTYGLGGNHKLLRLFSGLGWGVVSLSLLVLTLWKTGLLIVDSRLLFGTTMLRYGAGWLLGFLLVGLLEEYLTRGYLQFTLSRGLAGFFQWALKTRHSAALGFWTAALILSVLFGLGHGTNPGESPIGLLSAGLAAMVFCFSLWRTGSLWWAIGFHATWDWAQSFLYGVADSGTMIQHHLLATRAVGKPLLSGGATGPEGSVFILPIMALISLIILFTLPRIPHDGNRYASQVHSEEA